MLTNAFSTFLASLLAAAWVAGAAAAQSSDPQQALIEILERDTGDRVVPGAQLVVYRSSDDALVFSHSAGDFDPNEPILIASASKWVTAGVFMALVTDGVMPLQATTEDILGWDGAAGGVTLPQLLSFTSGLRERFCGLNANTSLADCSERVYRGSRNNLMEGSVYAYGNAPYVVAGHMAETATGLRWQDVFDRYLREPLGMSQDARYWAFNAAGQASDNPSLDGGLMLTVDDYVRFLRMIDNRGVVDGERLIRDDLITEMERSQFRTEPPITRVRNSPGVTLGHPHFQYGLGNWVECRSEGDCENVINSSEGAAGYYPWIDRQNGYFAILAMRGNNRVFGRESATQRSVDLVFELRPHILDLLAGMD